MSEQPQSVLLDDVLITEELSRRSPRQPDWQAENQAMRSLARQLAQASEQMLQCLVDLAVELCKAGTAGVSLAETQPDGKVVFRWVAMAGDLASHMGDCVPYECCPCGICLDQQVPLLFSHPERYFTRFQQVGVPLVESLVLPLIAEGQALGTIWIMTHDEQRQFDSEDVRLMTGLADFTAATLLRQQQQARKLSVADTALQQESVERKLAEERSLALIENLPGGAAFVVDRDLRYSMAAGEALAIAHFQPEDFVGQTIFEVLPPELIATYEPLYRQALAGKPFEHEHQAHDRWYISRGTPLRTEGGDIYGVLAVSYDITDRKHAEAALQANAERQSFLLQLSDALQPLTNAEAIRYQAARILGQHLEANRVGYAEADDNDETIVVTSHHTQGVPGIEGRYRYDDYGPDLLREFKAGRTVVRGDIANDSSLTEAEKTAHAVLQLGATVNVPLLKEGRLVAVLFVHFQLAHDWSDSELMLITEVADRIWAAVERARAEAITAADLRDTQRLRELSARLTSEADIQVLYNEIMATAITLTRADAGTVQILDEATQDLLLLATQGFERNMNDYFYRVNASSNTPCGMALAKGGRTFVDFDVPESEDPDGSYRMHVEAGLLSAQSTPLITRSGRPIGMVSTHWQQHHRPSDRELRFLDLLARQAADLIEQRQAEQERQDLLRRERAARAEAEQANRVKDEFLAVLSHELRSPLNPILGWSKLLQTHNLDTKTTQSALATIERNAKLQTQLINDLLDVARILRGKLQIEDDIVNLALVVEAALEVVRNSAEAKGISLQFDLIQICEVKGDEGRLTQVVWNLLSNAIKFTPAGGQVKVRLEEKDRQAQITVTDTGKGIRRDFLPHLFQAFRQEDTSITRQYGGLGLGLSIVKYLVDAHGGTVTADSLGEGQGATFIVQLSLRQEQPIPRATVPSSSESLDLTGIKVLAVDDTEDTRDLLEVVLTQYGGEVVVAASGSEALAHLRAFQPNVLVCDIGMPNMNGYELMQQIRSLPHNQGGNIPAIAVTAFARDEDRQRALRHGFQQHIPKPIELKVLASAIAQLAMR